MTNKEYLIKINAGIADILKMWDTKIGFADWLESAKTPKFKTGDVVIRRKDNKDYVHCVARIEDVLDNEYKVRFFTKSGKFFKDSEDDTIESRTFKSSWEDTMEKISIDAQ